MPLLKVKVRCFRCGKKVEKVEARESYTADSQPRYECFTCFKHNLPRRFKVQDEVEKKEFYCARCRYRFTSRVPTCPYCDQDDRVLPGKISVHDLL